MHRAMKEDSLMTRYNDDCVGVCGNVCVGDVMNVVFSVCIVRCGSVGARVWEMGMFRQADVVCLCLVCIMWQSLMLRSA